MKRKQTRADKAMRKFLQLDPSDQDMYLAVWQVEQEEVM